MAMYLSQKWAKNALEWISGVAVAPPLSLTARFWSVAPDETGTGGTELVGGGYTPATVTLGDPANGTGTVVAQVLNDAVFSFPDFPVDSDDVAAYSLHDEVGDLVVVNDSPTLPVFSAGANVQVGVGELLVGFTK